MPMDEIHRAAAAELANLRGEVQSLQSELAEERQKTASAQELLSAEVAKGSGDESGSAGQDG